jgi:polyhydroxyalkanoate synthesis regulator phasin
MYHVYPWRHGVQLIDYLYSQGVITRQQAQRVRDKLLGSRDDERTGFTELKEIIQAQPEAIQKYRTLRRLKGKEDLNSCITDLVQ